MCIRMCYLSGFLFCSGVLYGSPGRMRFRHITAGSCMAPEIWEVRFMYDVVVIGAGVTGCAVARELSRYDLKICVLEREEDVCCGTSKANSGIVHAGHDARPGSLKAKFNLMGNEMMEDLSKELDFPFRRNGSMVLCFKEEEKGKLEELKRQGEENGVKGLRILEREEIRRMEPNLTENAVAALYAPSGGIVCPFGLTIALAENAYVNGAEFRFNTEVASIERVSDTGREGYLLRTDKGEIRSRAVVNAAGVYADTFNNMVSGRKLSIIPRKGEYRLLDKSTGKFVDKTIFQMPTELGKGVLITPTVHGNLMVGPTAADIEDKEGVNTTAEGLEEVALKAALSAEHVPGGQVITSFAGLRAHEAGDDFVIGEAEDAAFFFNAAGIESPGLTSAPAIGAVLAEEIAGRLGAVRKEKFQVERKGIFCVSTATKEELADRIKENPAYGNVICRCETVTEGEIRDAVRRPLGAKSLDGVKRRTRAGMGRCQSGFCSPKVMEILAEELGCSKLELTKSGHGSYLLAGLDKENL